MAEDIFKPRATAKSSPAERPGQTAVRREELTARQRQIVELVAAGSSNREVAQALGLSEGTVKVHLHTIYDRLGIGSRAELTQRFFGSD